MRPALRLPWLFGPLAAVAGCASILGIPDASLDWCGQAANQHAFCDDFDHAGLSAMWPGSPPVASGAMRGVTAGLSSPYALDTEVGALDAGQTEFTGLERSFQPPFDDVTVGAEVRVAQTGFAVTAGGLLTGAGFLLLADLPAATGQPSLCVGLGLAPATASESVEIVLFLLPNSTNCLTITNPMIDGQAPPVDGADSEAGAILPLPAVPVPYPVGQIFLDTWTNLTLEVKRNPDGSGSLGFNASQTAGGIAPLPAIPPGSLGPGSPEVAIGTDVAGPSSGPFEVQFDDVTVDFAGD